MVVVVGVITEFVTKVLVKDTKDMVASLITGRNKTRRGQLDLVQIDG